MFLNILKSLYNLFCSSPSKTPQQVQETQSHHQQYGYSEQHSQKPTGLQPSQKPSKPHHATSRPHEDLNHINQSNDYYVGLRARANEAGDQMAKAFEESHQAYSRGDKAEAKNLSNRGKEHQRKMESLNKEACEWIFTENNKDSRPGEIDLHGLYVKEAIAYTDYAIQEAKQRGELELHLIVGKGLHSTGGSAKIKPAIEELMQRHQLNAQLDPHNAGVLIVQINSTANRGVRPDEISRRLERDESCTIM
ncbi:hypothetical protein BDZ94DRAFT_1264161 [Collybia nuda]|uniref:Smr domain-containing protein n=1 Tax=Collybia nuda TaxID=64659 RepID=A0A9P6CGJ6_9AGAR|nr:hypothetical protein BDZ94DRAFT_1264161 [Collybia nuda]